MKSRLWRSKVPLAPKARHSSAAWGNAPGNRAMPELDSAEGAIHSSIDLDAIKSELRPEIVALPVRDRAV
jgi:hypothetical protein